MVVRLIYNGNRADQVIGWYNMRWKESVSLNLSDEVVVTVLERSNAVDLGPKLFLEDIIPHNFAFYSLAILVESKPV